LLISWLTVNFSRRTMVHRTSCVYLMFAFYVWYFLIIELYLYVETNYWSSIHVVMLIIEFHVTWSLIINLNCFCNEKTWNVMPALIAFCATRWDTSFPCQNQEGEFLHLKVLAWQLQGSDCLILKYDAHLMRSWWIILCSNKQARPMGGKDESESWVILSITRKKKTEFYYLNFPSATISHFNVYM
jgi:hypothetical protein